MNPFKYKCTKCSKKYHNIIWFIRHWQDKHTNKPFTIRKVREMLYQ